MNHVTSEALALKTCTKCVESKPLSHFYQYRTGERAGKYHPRCRECQTLAARKNYADDPRGTEKQRLKMRAQRDANPEKHRERSRVHATSNPESKRASAAKAKVANRERTRAHNAVYRAVRRGLLPPPDTMVCDSCDEALAAHYHHFNGYEREHWFDIEPLCTECHGREHRVS